MTAETHILFDLRDIKTIQFECKACQSRFVCSPDKWNGMPAYCGNCKEALLSANASEQQAVTALRQAVMDLLKFYDGSKLVIRFEISK